MTLRGRVEPHEQGTWRFFCDCGGEQHNTTRPIGCSRIVVDSEINFRCETPIREATQAPCMIVHQLQPLIDAYTKAKKKADAARYLEQMEQKKQDALKTLGITEAQYNTSKNPPITQGGK